MPISVATAARKVIGLPAKRQLAGQIIRSATDLMRMPDSRTTWPRYRKAIDKDSSFYLEYRSNGNRVDSLVFHDGDSLHNLAMDNLMKLDDETLKKIHTKLTQRRGNKYLVLSETQEPPTYAPGNRTA